MIVLARFRRFQQRLDPLQVGEGLGVVVIRTAGMEQPEKFLEGMDIAGRGGNGDVLSRGERELPHQSVAEDDAVGIGGERVDTARDDVVTDRRDVAISAGTMPFRLTATSLPA